MTASASSQTNPSPFDFAPQQTQDTDLLAQLGFLPGLKELLLIRQVHALEHATVWVLGERSTVRSPRTDDTLGGMSTERGFYLYGDVNSADLHRAVHTALERLVRGEWDLAVHPRCGTNLSVGMLLTAGLAFGITMLIPKDPIGQILGLGIAATAATQLAPDVGAIAQRYLTTSIPFNLAVTEVTSSRDRWGRPVHFVAVRWVE